MFKKILGGEDNGRTNEEKQKKEKKVEKKTSIYDSDGIGVDGGNDGDDGVFEYGV